MRRGDGIGGVRSVLSIISFIDGVSLGLLLPLLPFVVKSWGGDAFTVTALVALFSAMSFLVSPVLGAASDRFGRKRILLVSLGVASVAYVMIGFATSLTVLFLLRAITGLTANNSVLVNAAIIDLSNDRVIRTAMLSKVGGWKAFGMLAGPVLGGMIAQIGGEAAPAQLALVAFAGAAATALTACYAMAAFPGDRRTRVMGAPADPPGWADVARLGDLLYASASIAYGFGVFSSVTALYVLEAFQWGALETGYVVGLLTGAVAITRIFIAPQYIAWVGASLALYTSMFVFALAMLFAVSVPSPWAFCVSYLFISVAFSVSMVTVTVGFAERAPDERRGTVMGMSTSLFSLGTVLSALVSGFVFDTYGKESPYVLGSMIIITSLIVLLVTSRRTRQAGVIQ